MLFRCITEDMAAILNSELFDHLPTDTYLAGGTAVALYMGHRLSFDLDFFTPNAFDSLALSGSISEVLRSRFTIATNQMVDNTLTMSLNDTGLSLFRYAYPLLKDPVFDKDIPTPVASQLDLSLMKLIAINQRGSCKDFVDLRLLIQRNGYSFQGLVGELGEKYGIGNEMSLQLKKSLVYFDDAEKDLNVFMYDSDAGEFERLEEKTWEATKMFFQGFLASE